MNKKISVAALQSLKEALTLVYWYKSDLRSFLSQCLSSKDILAQLNWDDYKRNIVATLVNHLANHQSRYQEDLLKLISEICQVNDFSHLKKLEGGEQKSSEAQIAINALRIQCKGYQDLEEEKKRIKLRKEESHKRLLKINAVNEKIDEIKCEYFNLFNSSNPQRRGYILEKILNQVFLLFELDPRASFRIVGEQIDGAFSFDGTDYLLEAKWQKELVSAKELDGMAGKLSRKLENTLGLFLSINGFSSESIQAHSSGRRLILLMDGSDLMAVLEGRIDLTDLLIRKRRHASETGSIYLKVCDIL